MYIYFTGGENAKSHRCSSRMFIMELNPLIKVGFSDLCNPAVTPCYRGTLCYINVRHIGGPI